MCFQAPGNTALALIMLTYYKTPLMVVTGQFANQGFNAVVNFSNAPQPVFKIQVNFHAYTLRGCRDKISLLIFSAPYLRGQFSKIKKAQNSIIMTC